MRRTGRGIVIEPGSCLAVDTEVRCYMRPLEVRSSWLGCSSEMSRTLPSEAQRL